MQKILISEPDPEIAEIIEDALHLIDPAAVCIHAESAEQTNQDIRYATILLENVESATRKQTTAASVRRYSYAVGRKPLDVSGNEIDFIIILPAQTQAVKESLQQQLRDHPSFTAIIRNAETGNADSVQKQVDETDNSEQVTTNDLKGKKVDADPENPTDQPLT